MDGKQPKGVEMENFEDASPQAPVQPNRHQSDTATLINNDAAEHTTAEKATSVPHLPSDIEKKHIALQDSNEKGAPRSSTQLARKPGRKSAEFDRRTDGPFGRASLNLNRRGSRQLSVVAADDEHVPTIPAQFTAEGEAPQSNYAPETIVIQPEPPALHYELWPRKWWILGFWTLVVFDSVVCPIALYFGLWYGLEVYGKMSANTVFSIVTAAVGGMSIVEYFLRLWKLVNKNSTCRVIDAKWWHVDFFHWNFTFGWILIMVELIVGTIQEHPPPRLVTMVVPTMLYVFAIELLVLDTLRYFEIPAPIRLSSIPKGAQVRPGIYTIVEDIVAVDGSGGTAYREALNVRYEASHVFRAMLRRLGLFWSIGSAAMATICTILIFTVQVDAAYTIGWALPFLWAGVWTLLTIWYVKKKLKEEKVAWREEIEKTNVVSA